MKQRKTILYILVLVALSVAGVVAFSGTSIDEEEISVSGWHQYTDEIADAVKKVFTDDYVHIDPDFAIVKTGEVTGDTVPEAFVDIGAGGASSNRVTLVQVLDKKVHIGEMKLADGAVVPISFMQGASILHAQEAGFDEERNLIYQGSVLYDTDGSLDSCQVEAFTWNYVSTLFEYDEDISREMSETFCRSIPERVD